MFPISRVHASVICAYVSRSNIRDTCGHLLSIHESCHSMVVSWVESLCMLDSIEVKKKNE